MNYPGIVALLVCSMGVVCAAFALQFIHSGLPGKERRSMPAWLMAAALLLFCVALFALRTASPTQSNTFNSLALTATMLTGVCSKWLCETIAQKKLALHEAVLAKAMLIASLAVFLFGSRIFPARLAPGVFVLWFLNGYFWHAVFSDIERITTPEKLLIRRREPPTLPYDFRKPEIE